MQEEDQKKEEWTGQDERTGNIPCEKTVDLACRRSTHELEQKKSGVEVQDNKGPQEQPTPPKRGGQSN